MNTSDAQRAAAQATVWGGIVALAIAMGIGRFAFTPLLPLMVRDGTLDGSSGPEWAAANYAGYLLGALTAARFSRNPLQGLRLGLVGVVLTTLGVACVPVSLLFVGALLRGFTGIFSAWVLVCTSAWCLPALARSGATQMGGWVYTGVGIGIAIAGALCWLGGNQTAMVLWVEIGVLAALGTGFVVSRLKPDSHDMAKIQATYQPAQAHLNEKLPNGSLALPLCYAAFGFGYIIPATFLPTMARELMPDPLVFGLTWPVFGMAAIFSVGFSVRCLAGWTRRKLWAVAQAIMAVGVLVPLFEHSLWGLSLSALLVGGTFMVTTMAGFQLGREQMPSNPTPLLARMTTGFASGQILGPVLVRLIGNQRIVGCDALTCASLLAALFLAASAIWLWQGFTERPIVNR